MANTPTAAFAQFPQTLTEEVAAADDITTSTQTNTVLIVQADATNGGILTKVTAIQKATTVAIFRLDLFTSKDGGTNQEFFKSVEMPVHAVAITDEIPQVDFGFSEDVTKRLKAGEEIWAGSSTALAGGINFTSEWSDF